jgi:hypothetical protein
MQTLMFIGHGNDYLNDSIALVCSLIPFVFVFALIGASLLEEPLKVRATASRMRRD